MSASVLSAAASGSLPADPLSAPPSVPDDLLVDVGGSSTCTLCLRLAPPRFRPPAPFPWTPPPLPEAFLSEQLFGLALLGRTRAAILLLEDPPRWIPGPSGGGAPEPSPEAATGALTPNRRLVGKNMKTLIMKPDSTRHQHQQADTSYRWALVAIATSVGKSTVSVFFDIRLRMADEFIPSTLRHAE